MGTILIFFEPFLNGTIIIRGNYFEIKKVMCSILSNRYTIEFAMTLTVVLGLIGISAIRYSFRLNKNNIISHFNNKFILSILKFTPNFLLKLLFFFIGISAFLLIVIEWKYAISKVFLV
jgi:hypothetical protein